MSGILILLFLKHYLVDFVFQTDEQVKGKGIYGDPHGISHSLEHGLTTFILVSLYTGEAGLSMVCAIIDFILHYHIDWAKMRFGCRDINNKLFWNHLGLDQYAHALTYILLANLIVQ